MPSKPIPRPLPDDPDDSDTTMEHLLDVASGDDQYWQRRVQAAFETAGFAIRRVEREQYHQCVWRIWVTCTTCDLPRDKKAASVEVRRALGKCGLKIRPGEITVIEQRGPQLTCAFMFGPAGPPADI